MKGKHCTGANTCAECASDDQCEGNDAGERCNSRGACSCASTDDCKEPGLGLCRDEGCVCSDDSGCPTGAKRCDLGVCIACDKDSQCDGEKSKCIAGGSQGAFCGCASDDECGLTEGEGPYCLGGSCVACKKNSDCGGTAPICNTGTGSCQQCAEAADCEKIELGSICTDGVCNCEAAGECGAKNSTTKLEWVCE